jgi:hypothetical protein
MGENEISEYFSLALSLEYIILTHRDSKGIIYIKSAYDVELDPQFIELFRTAINDGVIDFPDIEGEFEHATFEGKYILTLAGKKVWITIFINQKPSRYTREALNLFSKELENNFGGRIKNLYSRFQGDVSIFQHESITKITVEDIIEDAFHLSLKLPYKLGSKKGKEIIEESKKMFSLAKRISRKGKKIINLEDLLHAAYEKFDYNTDEIIYLINDLIEKEILIPIFPEKMEVQY